MFAVMSGEFWKARASRYLGHLVPGSSLGCPGNGWLLKIISTLLSGGFKTGDKGHPHVNLFSLEQQTLHPSAAGGEPFWRGGGLSHTGTGLNPQRSSAGH